MIGIMSDALWRRLSGLGRAERRYRAGQFLFRQGDPVRWLFAVRSGEVHLVRYQPDGFSLTLQRAGAGGLLAEASLFASHYHCDAAAQGPVDVSVFAKSEVRDAFARDPSFAQDWCAHLAREVQAARTRSEIVALRMVSERLDAWLATSGGELPARGSWKKVAGEIATSPEALYRELARRRRVAR